MKDYDNTDTGALFKNDKRGNEKAPDYTGDIYDATGKKRRIAAWIKTSSSGMTYMSLKVENLRPPRQTPAEQPSDYAKGRDGETAPVGGDDFYDRDIPFAPVDWRAS